MWPHSKASDFLAARQRDVDPNSGLLIDQWQTVKGALGVAVPFIGVVYMGGDDVAKDEEECDAKASPRVNTGEPVVVVFFWEAKMVVEFHGHRIVP